MDQIESIKWESPIFFITIFVLGCCVGSYLNAVIYRLPRGLSTSDPKRSFCPICKKPIPFYRNIPIFTWIVQRGKCAECDAPIAPRYLLVELLTGLVWAGLWWFFTVYSVEANRWIAPEVFWYPGAQALFFIVLATIAIVITFVDIEHMIIPICLSIGGAVVAIIGAMLFPWHLGESTWIEGLKVSVIGGVLGLISLYLVVRVGKLLFGKTKVEVDEPIEWFIREAKEGSDDPNENICLMLDNEENFWHDIFFRNSDRLVMNGVIDLVVNGEVRESSEIIIKNDKLILLDEVIELEALKSISGKVTSLLVPREAMGMGDVHLLGVIGFALGYQSLLLVIIGACFIGILLHLIAGKGFGKPLPFGPSLILGALLWMLYGPELISLYLDYTKSMIGG